MISFVLGFALGAATYRYASKVNPDFVEAFVSSISAVITKFWPKK